MVEIYVLAVMALGTNFLACIVNVKIATGKGISVEPQGRKAPKWRNHHFKRAGQLDASAHQEQTTRSHCSGHVGRSRDRRHCLLQSAWAVLHASRKSQKRLTGKIHYEGLRPYYMMRSSEKQYQDAHCGPEGKFYKWDGP